jgi:hypothetical protein
MGWPSSTTSLRILPSLWPPLGNSYTEQRCLSGLPNVKSVRGHKAKVSDAPNLVAPKWTMEFHVHTNVSNLVIKTMLAQNPIEKCY